MSQWTCPYCNRPCTIGAKDDTYVLDHTDFINSEYGFYTFYLQVVTCPNKECRKQTIHLVISFSDASGLHKKTPIFSARLVPETNAKQFPDYIPKAILEDYREACLILEKSPKASAKFSRRCLQGMIRDFWGIRKENLFHEIQELKDNDKVDKLTWDAIDSVRTMGNIGAHMEKDVNLIIDVDPDEAAHLIWLIETLFEDWYIARHEKEERIP